MKKFFFAFLLALVSIGCFAQPPKKKPSATTSQQKSSNQFTDTLLVKSDTLKARVVLFDQSEGGNYMNWQTGWVIKKSGQYTTTGGKMDLGASVYTEKWVLIDPKKVFDLRPY